jgi:hypothetical protein
MGSELDDDQSDSHSYNIDMSPLETEDVPKDTHAVMKKSPPSKVNFTEINQGFGSLEDGKSFMKQNRMTYV